MHPRPQLSMILALAALLPPERPAPRFAPRKPTAPARKPAPPVQVCRVLPRPPAEVVIRPKTPLHFLHVRHTQLVEQAAAAGNTRRGRALRRQAAKVARAIARAEKGEG